MDLLQAIKERHSVRSFTSKRIDSESKAELRRAISELNRESGLNIQLCTSEPEAFDSTMAHYGKFKNCKNYLVLAGKNGMDEKCGYYGEKLVLLAQQLGLNTCWVAMSYSKSKVPCNLKKGEKIYLVIALGYGDTQGVQHKSKALSKLCKADDPMPEWFKKGMDAVVLAPTALNQQRFMFTQSGNTVSAVALTAFYSEVDLGIAKCHFEIGAGKENFEWK